MLIKLNRTTIYIPDELDEEEAVDFLIKRVHLSSERLNKGYYRSLIIKAKLTY